MLLFLVMYLFIMLTSQISVKCNHYNLKLCQTGCDQFIKSDKTNIRNRFQIVQPLSFAACKPIFEYNHDRELRFLSELAALVSVGGEVNVLKLAFVMTYWRWSRRCRLGKRCRIFFSYKNKWRNWKFYSLSYKNKWKNWKLYSLNYMNGEIESFIH